jgi:hypothetical protein
MRRDYIIAILLAVSAVPLGAALMVAPDYLHLTGYFVPVTFWGGMALATALISVAAIVALRGERSGGLAISPHSHRPRNVPLIDAIWRAHLGRWADRIDYGNDDASEASFQKTVDAIRQMARDGKLPIWGTRRKGNDSNIYNPIPLSFWSTHDIETNYVINPLVKDTWVYVTEPTDIWQVRYARTWDWTNFMTSREVVEELWPKGREPVS